MSYKPQFIGWYSENYREQVASLLFPAPKVPAKIIIVPHAGYHFTGSVLADVYSRVDFSSINKIILLCTMHRSLPNLVLPSFTKVHYSESDQISINTAHIELLSKISGFLVDDADHFNKEHSFEMQLPFIMALTKAHLTPILIGHHSNYDSIAKHLLNLIDDQTLIIVSTDFIHYGPNYHNVVSIAHPKKYILKNDFKNFQQIIANDIDNFASSANTVCGKNALLLMMHINRYLKLNPSLTSYETSADDLDDSSDINSVSYAGFIYAESTANNNLKKMYAIKKMYIEITNQLKSNQRIDLNALTNNNRSLIPRVTLMVLDVIFTTIDIDVNTMYSWIIKALTIDEPKERFGIFITYEEFLNLQGCIGTYYDTNHMPVNHSIIYYTLKTIFEDSRFPDNPLRHKTNYKYLHTSDRYNFKVNFLQKNFRVEPQNFWAEYIPCVHGIVLRYRDAQATFLPLVMLEQHWIKDCRTTLSPEQKKFFEQKTFGALIRKMGYNDSWVNWTRGRIYLYTGNEISESF